MGKYLLGCGALLVIGVIILVISVGSFWATSYNNLVGQKQNVDAKWADVQNGYQRRADLIPNLVQTVAGAANFEKSTLTDITEARASVGQVKIDPNHAPATQDELNRYAAAQSSLGGALSRLLVVTERYPDLKSDQNFLALQSQLEGTENRIAVARGDFNAAAQAYNTTVQRFPTNFVANFSGFTQRPYFQASEGAEKPPQVQFHFNSTNTAPALLAAALLFVLGGVLRAQPHNLPPKPDRYIVDHAGVMDAGTLNAIDMQLDQFERETSNQLVVAIYPALPEDAELYDYCTYTARAWNVGQKGRDNGAVLFVFVQDRKMYIAVGRGLEGSLTDLLTQQIRDNIIAPYFRKGDYAGGIQAGVNAIIAVTKGEFKGTGRTVDDARQGASDGRQIPTWVVVLIFIIFLIFITRANVGGGGGPFIYTGGGWGGGSGGWCGGGGGGGGFSGGGFSGGGGSFGGGGSGGGW
jgi:uncharacterized membrane protein YgcG